MIAARRLPLPGFDGGEGGGGCCAIGAATLLGFVTSGFDDDFDGDGNDFSPVGAPVSTGVVES